MNFLFYLLLIHLCNPKYTKETYIYLLSLQLSKFQNSIYLYKYKDYMYVFNFFFLTFYFLLFGQHSVMLMGYSCAEKQLLVQGTIQESEDLSKVQSQISGMQIKCPVTVLSLGPNFFFLFYLYLTVSTYILRFYFFPLKHTFFQSSCCITLWNMFLGRNLEL